VRLNDQESLGPAEIGACLPCSWVKANERKLCQGLSMSQK